MKNRQLYYQEHQKSHQGIKLPSVHYKNEMNAPFCKSKKSFLLEDRAEKVTCKKCLKAMEKIIIQK